jgi:hypothetical protein
VWGYWEQRVQWDGPVPELPKDGRPADEERAEPGLPAFGASHPFPAARAGGDPIKSGRVQSDRGAEAVERDVPEWRFRAAPSEA